MKLMLVAYIVTNSFQVEGYKQPYDSFEECRSVAQQTAADMEVMRKKRQIKFGQTFCFKNDEVGI